MKIHVVIPARMASTRLPGKPLAMIAGIPMIVRVVQQAKLAQVDSVIAAVDDTQVQSVVERAGFQAMLTALDHPSGSDRVMEVVVRQGWSDEDVVINVQGDEPLVPPAIIDQLGSAMVASPEIDVATLCEPIATRADFLDPNIVKVVLDVTGKARYFSRAPIPFPRDEMLGRQVSDQGVVAIRAQRHIGVYGFRVAALRKFVGLKNSHLEQIERLEQLRWLEAGGSISVLECAEAIPGGVDTPEDLARVEQFLASAH